MRSAIVFIAVAWLISAQAFGQRFQRTLSNITELTTSNPNTIHTGVEVAGRLTAGDGGGGKFWYDPTSTATVDDGVVFDVSGYPGRWIRQVEGGIYFAEWWGAVGDGVTDSSTAIAKAIQAANPKKGTVALGLGTFITSGTTLPQWSRFIGLASQGQKNQGEGATILKLKAGTVGGAVIKATGEFQLENIQIDGNKSEVFGSPLGIWVDKSGIFAESMISGVSVVNCQGDGAYIDAHEVKIRDCTFTKGDARGLVLDDTYDVMADHVLTGWNGGNGFEAKVNGATLRVQQLDSYYNRGSGVIIRSPLWVYIDRLQCDFNFQNGTEIEVGSTASNIQINYPLIYGSNVDQDNFGVLNPAASGTYSDFVISGTQYPKSIRIDGGKIGNSTASTKKPEYHIKWINSQPGVGFGTRLLDVDLDTNSGANTSTGKSTQDTWLTGSWTGRILNHRDGTNVRTVTKESYVYATTDFTTSPVLNILNNYDLVVRSNIFAQGYLTANSAVYSGRGITSDKSGVQIKADTGSTIGMANIGDTFVIQNDVNSNPQISLNTRTGQSYLSGTSTNASGDWIALALKMTLNQSGTAGSRGFRAEMTPTALGSGSHRPFEYTYSGNTRWTVDHNGRMISTSPSGIGPLTLQSESGTDSRIRIYYSEVLDRDMDLKANLLDVKTLSGGTGATFSLNPSGGSVQLGGSLIFGSGGPIELKGSGSPEGVVAAPVSSTYRRVDGGSGTTLYVKETGAATSSGWVAHGAAGAGGVASSRQILTSNSLTGGGDLSADRTLSLVNDTASPGANKVYGTDGSGVRGWKNDPAGGGGGAGYGGTSTTSVSFGTGSKTWTTQTGLAYIAGSRVRAVETGSSQWMEGEIISYSGGTLTVNVDLFSGIGTYSNWGFSVAGVRGAQGVGFVDADYGQISISGGVTSISIDPGAVSTTELGGDITAAGKDLLNDASVSAQRTTLGVPPSTRSIATANSLAGGGDLSADRTIQLVNDSASPGANKVYGTDASGVKGWKNDPAGSGGGDALVANPLSQFAATTSAQLAGVLSNESGTGLAVFNDGSALTNATINGIDLRGTAGSTINVGTGGTLGTAAFTAASAYQAADGELSAIAGLTSAADTLPYFSGSGTASTTSLTSAGRTLIGGANAAAQRTSLGLVIGTDVQAFDADLSAVAGLSTSGLVARTGAGTAASRSITGPAAGITVSNGDGAAGNPTIALANDLSAVEGLSGTGIARRTGTDTWSVGTTVSIAEGGTGQTSAKAAFDALNGAEATVASATTTDIGAASSDKVSITGTTTITGFGTATAGIRREGRFTGALLLTHNATSLILPGGASITTAAGDRFTAYSLGSGNWVVTSYTTASRTGTGADVQQNSPNFTGSPQVNGNDIGTLDILQNSQSANYTLVLGDRGKQIFHPSSDANSRTFTIPANASVAFPIGSTVTFINASANSCTIAITTDTLRKAGTGTTGSVTLPQHAVATITKVTTTEWYISGNGI